MRRFEWDDEKAKSNLRKHGVAFEKVYDFEFATSLERLDDRHDYGEERIIALGFIGSVLFTLTYTERGERIRVISLRKSTNVEMVKYAQGYD